MCNQRFPLPSISALSEKITHSSSLNKFLSWSLIYENKSLIDSSVAVGADVCRSPEGGSTDSSVCVCESASAPRVL